MLFPAEILGGKVTVLFDSGATHNFIEKGLVASYGLQVVPEKGSIVCGGESNAITEGFTRVNLSLQNFQTTVQCSVIDLPIGINLILGEAWLKPHKAQLDFGSKTVKMFLRGEEQTLRCEKRVPGSGILQPLLNAKQFKREIRRASGKAFTVYVQKGCKDRFQSCLAKA